MKITAFALSAALLGLATITPANAMAPSAVGHATAKADGVTLVAQKVVKKRVIRNRNGVVTKKVVHKHSYRAGGRYKHAPRGWKHQYRSRPGDWSSRGCVTVGPIWWCP